MNDSDDVIYEADAQSFDQLVRERSQYTLVVVDFWAPWCAPCRTLAPLLLRLVETYAGKFTLVKVNTDEQRELAQRYAVRSLPTVKLFRLGQVVDEFYGAQPESVIRELLERHIERASDELRRLALAALEQGNAEEAVARLTEAIQSEPENYRIHPDLARALLGRGNADQAEEILRMLPPHEQEQADVRALRAQLSFAKVAASAPSPKVLYRTISNDPDNCEARYQLCARKTLDGDYEGAMEELLEILRRDRSFREDAGRKGLLSIFELLGGSGPLVGRFRTLMSSALH